MGAVRFVLALIAVGAVLLWMIAAINGFSGTYCFNTSGSCNPSSDVTLQWGTVLWAAPIVFVIAAGFLFALRLPR
jgi:hypothetical protein